MSQDEEHHDNADGAYDNFVSLFVSNEVNVNAISAIALMPTSGWMVLSKISGIWMMMCKSSKESDERTIGR